MSTEEDLSGYDVEFGGERSGAWWWQARTPGGGFMASSGAWFDLREAELDALRMIKAHYGKTTRRMNGEELRRRVEAE